MNQPRPNHTRCGKPNGLMHTPAPDIVSKIATETRSALDTKVLVTLALASRPNAGLLSHSTRILNEFCGACHILLRASTSARMSVAYFSDGSPPHGRLTCLTEYLTPGAAFHGVQGKALRCQFVATKICLTGYLTPGAAFHGVKDSIPRIFSGNALGLMLTAFPDTGK